MGITDSGRSSAGHSARRWGAPRTVITAVLGLAFALAGCSSAPPQAEPSYGTLPTYLPSDTLHNDSVLDATLAKPAVTSQGDSVNVHLAAGSVTVTVTGPEVPGEGLPYDAPKSTCTWAVTVTGATADVPLTAAGFTSIDHLGAIYHPTLVAGQPTPPSVLHPGATVTFELRATMITGEGLMRWAPDGTHVIASWDFEVETD